MNATISTEGITCAKCTHWANGRRVEVKHPTIEAVRDCSMGRSQVRAANRGFQQALVDPAAAFAADFGGLSDAEEDRLIQERERAEDQAVAAYKAQRDEVVTSTAVPTVDAWARVRALQASLPNLPHMRYAIRVTDLEKSPEPVWKFYQIDKPTKGRWIGRTFVNVMASDDTYPVKRPESLIVILTAIADDPAKAASDYGHQIGKCGICHRTLTDPESIARGIGPICADKAGW